MRFSDLSHDLVWIVAQMCVSRAPLDTLLLDGPTIVRVLLGPSAVAADGDAYKWIAQRFTVKRNEYWPTWRDVFDELRREAAAEGSALDIVGSVLDGTPCSEEHYFLICGYGLALFASICIASGVDVNAKPEESPVDPSEPNSVMQPETTVLNIASDNGDTALVACLLATPGIDVNAEDYRGKTCLIRAVENQHWETARLLLKSSEIDVKPKDWDYWDALGYATSSGHAPTVKLLLDKNADVNGGERRVTPLHRAASLGRTDIVDLLLAAGAVW